MGKIENPELVYVLPQKITPTLVPESSNRELITHSDAVTSLIKDEFSQIVSVSLEEGLITPTEDISGIIYDSSELNTSLTPPMDYVEDISVTFDDLVLDLGDSLSLTYSGGIDIQMAKKGGSDTDRAKKRRERQRERDKVKHDNGLGSGTRVDVINIPGRGPVPCVRKKGKWRPIK